MTGKLLIANRGEIAVRIIRTARALGYETVAIYTDDDAEAQHVYRADTAVALGATGVAGYLDIERIVSIATEHGVEAVHPGYGLLSENATFAAACARAGVRFVGPIAAALQQFGDKANARRLAFEKNVPTLAGTTGPTSFELAQRFFTDLAGRAMIIKAVAGGGGRGVRVVTDQAGLQDAWERCASEAQSAFGNPALYVEEYLAQARHVEVQILGDQAGDIRTLGDRDCSFQRRHQKLIEIAPAPLLPDTVRDAMAIASVRLASAVHYQGAGTIEFLYNPAREEFAFIEANARLQVEHTVTEAIYGVDLVEAQLRIARGERLVDFLPPLEQNGQAIQCRINAEVLTEAGDTLPQAGTVTAFNPPFAPNIRLDTATHTGSRVNPNFDSMLAKLIVHEQKGDHRDVLARANSALSEFQVEGLTTNISLLQALISRDETINWRIHTRFIDDHAHALVTSEAAVRRYREPGAGESIAVQKAGADIDHADPFARDLDLVVPARAVEGGSVEAVQSFEVGHVWMVQHASSLKRTMPVCCQWNL